MLVRAIFALAVAGLLMARGPNPGFGRTGLFAATDVAGVKSACHDLALSGGVCALIAPQTEVQSGETLTDVRNALLEKLSAVRADIDNDKRRSAHAGLGQPQRTAER